MLGSNSRGLLNPEHRENVKVGQCTLDDKTMKVSIARWTAVNALDSSPRESLGVYL
jgi:hypothetical protein